jgi:hypothetical protein
MPRTRPPYPPESYREAVELVRYGVPLKQVAADVGVNEQTLPNRRHQGEIHAGRAEGLTSDERDERPRESRQVHFSRSARSSRLPRPSSPGRPIAGDVLPADRREANKTSRLPATCSVSSRGDAEAVPSFGAATACCATWDGRSTASEWLVRRPPNHSSRRCGAPIAIATSSPQVALVRA